MTNARAFALCLSILLTACASPGARPSDALPSTTGMWTPVWQRTHRGSGAVVGKHLVATVDHVYDDQQPAWSCANSPAVEVYRIRNDLGRTGYEDIVILRVAHQFKDSEVFKWNVGGDPGQIWVERGKLPWEPSLVIPGDSGAGILDDLAYLTAHVSARSCAQCAVPKLEPYPDQETIGSFYPSDFDPAVLKPLDK